MAAELTRTIPSGWQDVILVCRKCSKRQGGGFGPQGGKPLAKALRKHLGVKKGRKASVGIVEVRSEEHTSELQSLMRISYAVFCLKHKQHTKSRTSIRSITKS